MWQEDLVGLSAHVISEACKRYRRDEKNQFFPHPGAILGIARSIPDPGWESYKAEIERLYKAEQARLGQ